MKKVKVLGLMSGTSLDGVDLALCEFDCSKEKWGFNIERASTIEYPAEMLERLKKAHELSGEKYALLDADLGSYFGECVKAFLRDERCDLIASHGHTVFHQPEIGLTTQIGSGAAIYAVNDIPVACDFRAVDVFLGGQGAPLVPLGDRELFADYDLCVNLGGIANISFKEGNIMKAFDVCPVNQVLNYVALQLGWAYDKGGALAGSGNLNEKLLDRLNNLDFYHQPGPKSLGREWVEEHVFPLVGTIDHCDFLRTYVEHIAIQLGQYLKDKSKKALFTGGGSFNSFLIERLRKHSSENLVIVPEEKIINFKEALIFAFLGLRGVLGHSTSLSTVSGARRDSISMACYGVFKGN